MRNLKLNIFQFLTQLGQSFFMPQIYMGLLIILCTFFANSGAVFFGLSAALACRFTLGKIKANQLLSLVGFVDVNSFFLGVGMSYFFEASIAFCGVVLIMGVLLAYLIVFFQRILAPWQLPMLVLPLLFVLSLVWIFKDYSSVLLLKQPSVEVFQNFTHPLTLVALGVLRSFSQIFFSSSPIVASLFLIGLYLVSKKHFYVLLGTSVLSSLTLLFMGLDLMWISTGLLGFNSILVASAYLGLEEEFSVAQLGVLVFFSTLLSVVGGVFLNKLGLLSLSFPYVLTVWIYQLSKSRSSLMNRSGVGASKWIVG